MLFCSGSCGWLGVRRVLPPCWRYSSTCTYCGSIHRSRERLCSRLTKQSCRSMGLARRWWRSRAKKVGRSRERPRLPCLFLPVAERSRRQPCSRERRLPLRSWSRQPCRCLYTIVPTGVLWTPSVCSWHDSGVVQRMGGEMLETFPRFGRGRHENSPSRGRI